MPRAQSPIPENYPELKRVTVFEASRGLLFDDSLL
jgi:hypothetical protein